MADECAALQIASACGLKSLIFLFALCSHKWMSLVKQITSMPSHDTDAASQQWPEESISNGYGRRII